MKMPHPSPQRGQVLVIFALSCVVMVGMVALAVDAGLGFADARGEQNASDAAALTGAQAITAPSGSSGYSASKARMEAMVSLARNLGFMAQLSTVNCNGTPLTPNYTTTPASYNTDIDVPTCTGSGAGGLTMGAYTVAIYQPPQSGSHIGDVHAIEVRLTHKVATSFASVLGVNQLIGAVARWRGRSTVAGFF